MSNGERIVTGVFYSLYSIGIYAAFYWLGTDVLHANSSWAAGFAVLAVIASAIFRIEERLDERED